MIPGVALTERASGEPTSVWVPRFAGATVGLKRGSAIAPHSATTRLLPFGYFGKYVSDSRRQQLLFQGPGIILEPNACMDCSLSKWRVTCGWIIQLRTLAYGRHSNRPSVPLGCENRNAATLGIKDCLVKITERWLTDIWSSCWSVITCKCTTTGG